MGRGNLGHVTPFKFGTALLPLEQIKLDTSNLVHKWIVATTSK